MADPETLATRRTLEDWVSLALGVAIALAPWIVDETSSRTVVVHAAIAGLAVMLLAELDLVSFRRWAGRAQLAVGAWVAVSPLILGYAASGALRVWHVVAGTAVVLLAAFELWQSRNP